MLATAAKTKTTVSTAERILDQFAERTGLSGASCPRRELRADAFGVCGFLEAFQQTGASRPRELAERLVDQVHQTLGRYRTDDPRRGWISGLTDEEARVHPTRGGLRSGRPVEPRQPQDSGFQWEGDGQTFHDLTGWMHALSRLARITGRREVSSWARELAETAYAGFCCETTDGRKQLHSKMSTDLRRPLVAATSRRDPLDGLVTFLELRDSSGREHGATLAPEIAGLEALCEDLDLTTTDPFDLGALLADGYRLTQLIARGEARERAELLESVLESSAVGLEAFARSRRLEGPAWARLAFRELGLAIGLHAVRPMANLLGTKRRGSLARSARILGFLGRFVPVAAAIETFWLGERSQREAAWTEHLDLNAVTLATSLAPGCYLAI